MITVRRAAERGHSNLGWLDSYHTFSFADYYDPGFTGFRTLRVINEDRVRGGRGFGTHSHRDFEIVSYVVSGALEHKDSMGHGAVMKAGEVQRISAGTGIAHSEYNHSATEPVHFLQIWFVPSRTGVEPAYAQQSFADAKVGALTLACSGDGRDGSIRINQDVDLLIGRLAAESGMEREIADGRYAWIQLIDGDLAVKATHLEPGDGAAVSAETRMELASTRGAHFLLFDLG
jgi:redox-sensitive bicupin YhaK (pirin superfamily)